MQKVEELLVRSLVIMIEIGRILRIRPSKRVIQLDLLGFLSFNARFLLVSTHETMVRIVVVQIVQGIIQDLLMIHG